ncbi:BMP family ABC transporter substrate-binding protein [Xylanibacillus composti]|uniref:BMP family ABC transporter substrate-binding protein n=1 Tax=Xylanibacillus composti TaxID=1572762 RepID=A0A8J4GXZ5_9BACL|nr:BMP family ABC transporter substrate-binding protein [Xylanibacillus composti]MDT9726771.1 BMP family ABC transporter substrate-binding protein [Xylanibacillus composti]GIQ67247.1 BMP family ABC transporter substrate-binding protein [Xylanibacillus composti]
MKKSMIVLALVAMFASLLAGCGSSNEGSGNAGSGDTNDSGASFKVGMVTDAGTIDDKSFNQGTWEGVELAANEFGLEKKYLKPAGTTEADYMKEIGNLYDADFKFIVTPGYKFETAIFQAQERYADAKFVLIDGYPHNGDYNEVVGENTVSIFFAEHESGFLAGVATAVELQEGEAGFIGGMEIPAVQKFNWGFQQGLAYANENLGTNISLKPENVVYEGSFDNSAAGGQLAAQMFDRGVNVIFCAAGGVGIGAISEAKNRVQAGEEVWIVGVDVDQYADGVYDEDANSSVVLTSAMKKIDQVAYDMIKAELDGEFPGGEILTFDAKNDGVGIPVENPNLSDATVTQVDEIFAQIKAGEIVVSDEQGNLIK